MYCGSCIHDNALASALQRKGIDFALIPTYTPLRTDEPGASIDRVFYGGINVYLQQKMGIFRHTPSFVDRLLNSRTLLNSLARFSGSTRAEDLGALTVSVLEGEDGAQKKELAKAGALVERGFPARPRAIDQFNVFGHGQRDETGTRYSRFVFSARRRYLPRRIDRTVQIEGAEVLARSGKGCRWICSHL